MTNIIEKVMKVMVYYVGDYLSCGSKALFLDGVPRKEKPFGS